MLIGHPQHDHMPIQPRCERQRRREVCRQTETPCGRLACPQLLTCTCHRPDTSQGPSPSARHTNPGSVSTNDSSFSGPHSCQARQMPRDVPPPSHGVPHRVSSPRRSPRSSLYGMSGSTARRSAGAQPSMPAGGCHGDHSPFVSQVPRTVEPSEPPLTMNGVGDWQTRRNLGEAGSIRDLSDDDMRQAPRQQHQHSRRRRIQGDTRGRLSVVPEGATPPGRQGRHSSPYVVQDDDDYEDEARRSELPTTKEKRTGRLQQLLGKHSWWSSRKPN